MSRSRRLLSKFSTLCGGAILFGGLGVSGCDPETRAIITGAAGTAVTQVVIGLIELLFATAGLTQTQAAKPLALLLLGVPA
jgi:hypothetical protein